MDSFTDTIHYQYISYLLLLLCQSDGNNGHCFIFIIVFQKADIGVPMGINLCIRAVSRYHCMIVKSVLNSRSQLVNLVIFDRV